ncbi:hypothetical protein AB7M35_003781 [Amorphus suaedae]
MDEDLLVRISRAIAARAPGPFHFSEVYGPGWDRLYVGDKVKLGRDFMRAVDNGRFPRVVDTGRKAGGGRLYLLKGA